MSMKNILDGFQSAARRMRNRAAEHATSYMSSKASMQQSRRLKGEEYGLRIIFLGALFTFMLFPLTAHAGTTTLQALENFSKSFPAIWKLINATAFLLGFIFMFRAVHGFRQFGEGRGMHGHGHGLKLPLILFFVGAALVFSPSIMETLMWSTFGYGSPFIDPRSGGDWTAVRPVLLLVKLIGGIAFLRGWVMIVSSAQQGGHASLGKALTHIVGGLLAINIGGTIDILRQTFLGTG